MKTNAARAPCFRAALILLLATQAHGQVTSPPGSLPRSQSREPAATSHPAGSSVPVQNGLAPNNASQTLYQLPAGAYVLSYQDATGALQQFDATVTWDPRQIQHSRREVPDDMTISFGGRQYAGVLAAGSNRFASSQTAAGRPLLDGTLSADGAMSGNYFADDHGYPVRNPFQYTLNPKPLANPGTEQRARSGVGVPHGGAGSDNDTGAIAGTRPGSREALNPQPLPPMPGPNWNAKPGDASSLNPQPLPPMPGPNWNAKPGGASSLNPQPLPASGSPVAKLHSESAAAIQPIQNSKTVATQGARGGLIGSPVSDIAARRLRAAGLDPTSPTFRKQLDDRLQTNRKILTSQSTAATVRKPNVDSLRSKLRPPAGTPKMPPPQLQSAESRVAGPAVAPAPPPAQASNPLDALPPIDVLTAEPPYPGLQMPFGYVIPFTPLGPGAASVASQRERGARDSLSVRVTIPACGIDYTYVADLQTAEQMGGFFRDSNVYQAGLLDGRVFAWFPDFDTPAASLLFPLGASLRHGTVSLTVNGLTTAKPFDVNFAPGQPFNSGWSVAVDSSAPFIGTNVIGLTTANTAFAQPAIERVNLGDQPMEGEDVLGIGVQTGPGYVMGVAQIVTSHSVADLGGDAAPDNAYRGATVVVQPQSNRLQTTVKWHIGPGDSLQYQILWTMTGPYGQRPFTTMPLQGACDS